MSLAGLREVLPGARRDGVAVAAINVANCETLMAVVEAAEAERAPVIVQIYQRLLDTGLAGPLVAMGRHVAERASVPVVIHLDHAETFERIAKAIELGFTSVMIDGSKLPFDENVALTRKAVEAARRAGISIEGEIGHVAFGGGAGALTDPDEAVKFAEMTGVDALAVSVGTAHGYYKETPKIDLDRVAAIAGKIATPLVLHGGSGTPEDMIVGAVKRGVAKVNIATEFQHLFLKRTGEEVAKLDGKFMAVDLAMKPVVASLVEFAQVKIRMLAMRG